MEGDEETPERLHKIHGNHRSGPMEWHHTQSIHIQGGTAALDMLTSNQDITKSIIR